VSVRIPPVDDSKFVSKLGDKGKAPAESPIAASATTQPPKAEPAMPAASTATQATPAKDVGAPPPPPSRALTQAEQRVISPQSKPAAATDGPGASATAASKAPAAVTGGTAAPIAEPPNAADATTATKLAEPAKAAAVPKAAEPAAAGAYSVQLAAFADDKGANSLAAKLKRAGHPAYTEPYETSRGRVWRVRVGPYPSREAAEAARVMLKAEGQNGILAAAK
jgi:DedD protein